MTPDEQLELRDVLDGVLGFYGIGFAWIAFRRFVRWIRGDEL